MSLPPLSSVGRGGPGWAPCDGPLRDLLRAAPDLGAAALGWSGLADSGGEGAPVLVLPGFLADDYATWPMRRHLARNGWAVRGWGLGRNHGRVGALLPPLLDQIAALADRHGEAVRLVGWSLGGVLARELARRAPGGIRQVITMGSPVVGGAKYTAYAPWMRRWGVDLDAEERQVDARHTGAIPVPLDVIFSEQDGVVAWRASQDPRPGPAYAEHRVGGSHAGLILRPEVLRLVHALLRAGGPAAPPLRPDRHPGPVGSAGRTG